MWRSRICRVKRAVACGVDATQATSGGAAIASIGLPTVFVQEGGYLSDILGANLTAVLGGFEQNC